MTSKVDGKNDVDLLDASAAPSVDFLNSPMPVEPIKSTIGIRKIQPKRGVNFILLYFQ